LNSLILSKFCGLILLLFAPIFTNGQNEIDKIEDRNAYTFDVGGTSQTLFSLHYERIFQPKKFKYTYFSTNIGFGLQGGKYDQNTFFSFPLELNVFVGGKHSVEAGIGGTLFFGTSDLNNPKVPPEYRTNFYYGNSFRLGYQFINDNGLLIRAAPMVLINKIPPLGNCYKAQASFGFSIGRCF